LPTVTRVLGTVRGPRPGPTLVVIGGLHGNEPAGILALRRVLGGVERLREHVTGEFVAVSGNRGALARGRRFLHSDLNRVWTDERIRSLRTIAAEEELKDEAAEQRELLKVLDGVDSRARGRVYVLDLHTTSSVSGPWATIEDTLPSRAFALKFPIPIVLGLEEQVDGTLLEHASRSGHVSMVFEGGQHGDPVSVERSEAAVWVALAAGIVPADRAPGVGKARERLARDSAGLPRVLEMRYRHAILPTDGFRMDPGFVNLQPIREGEVLGRDRRGEVRSPERGRVLMPLYQEQGEDGFFVVREFRPVWLRISEILRRVGVGRVIHWLPGIRRAAPGSDVLIVDRRIARWFALEVLHLLGYRTRRAEGPELIVRRRSHDSSSVR
ncbi:MAG: aspartoacylase, partial [Gemmatimonadetes bacterium]|nr:aspartoacylase [Gemmatimonadota bacterium]NIR78671.1 aspartoacylase [Gemmatimonadota bacterium]NIT87177.1 aspartoacylase [Gemmatimonadota bacterium]NIU31008.1 aspartoacylase [Gemmatimonadota bacterium]NIU35762.1 aspartoacylase [Gemmatimonadota bacterium]